MEVASAQSKSAILFAIFSKEATTVTEIDVSRNHTETMFEHFNIPIKVDGKTIQTSPNAIQHIKAKDFHVLGISHQRHSLSLQHSLLQVATSQFIMLALTLHVQVS